MCGGIRLIDNFFTQWYNSIQAMMRNGADVMLFTNNIRNSNNENAIVTPGGFGLYERMTAEVKKVRA